ncbi:MAG: hypothetical protein DI563_07670 [Variovorax paradoxus]|uniref:Uncharacterized protein n=1 Tax=Variovorax paradoxus TaxID=34073 RepID=A0A2W5QID5_VARPD|nr:MAG: hypothetical protein DI563_07670 [Variovorax paradoxus]
MWISLAPAIQQDASRLRPRAVQVFGEEVAQVVLAPIVDDAWRTVFALADLVFLRHDAIPLGRSREHKCRNGLAF